MNYDDDLDNIVNYKYFVRYNLNNNLYSNYINNLSKYYIDNILDKINKNDNNKNEKGIDKGKYN